MAAASFAGAGQRSIPFDWRMIRVGSGTASPSFHFVIRTDIPSECFLMSAGPANAVQMLGRTAAESCAEARVPALDDILWDNKDDGSYLVLVVVNAAGQNTATAETGTRGAAAGPFRGGEGFTHEDGPLALDAAALRL
ncbi:MAG: hypothetical protein ABFC75_07110 [Rectinema sp.]